MASYRIISADNQLYESADLWASRVEPKFRDRVMLRAALAAFAMAFIIVGASPARAQKFPAKPFVADINLTDNSKKAVGPGVGTLGVTSLTISNFSSLLETLFIFAPVLSGASCSASVTGGGGAGDALGAGTEKDAPTHVSDAVGLQQDQRSKLPCRRSHDVSERRLRPVLSERVFPMTTSKIATHVQRSAWWCARPAGAVICLRAFPVRATAQAEYSAFNRDRGKLRGARSIWAGRYHK